MPVLWTFHINRTAYHKTTGAVYKDERPVSFPETLVWRFPSSADQGTETVPSDQRTQSSDAQSISATDQKTNSSDTQLADTESSATAMNSSTKRIHPTDMDLSTHEDTWTTNTPSANKTRHVPATTCTYRLVAVVVHHGGSHHGHFVTYRRGVRPDGTADLSTSSSTLSSWFCMSDGHVTRVTLQDVLSAEPYMLFYEKMDE